MFQNTFFACSEDIEHARLVMEVSNSVQIFEESYHDMRNSIVNMYGEGALMAVGKFIVNMIKGAFKGIIGLLKNILGMVFGAGINAIVGGGSGSTGSSAGSKIASSYVEPRVMEEIADSLKAESASDIAKLKAILEKGSKDLDRKHNRLAKGSNKRISLSELMGSISQSDGKRIQDLLQKHTIHNLLVDGESVSASLEKMFSSLSHKDLFGEDGKRISMAYPKKMSGTRMDNMAKAMGIVELMKECESINQRISDMITNEVDDSSLMDRFSNNLDEGLYAGGKGSLMFDVNTNRISTDGHSVFRYLNSDTNAKFTAISKAAENVNKKGVRELKIVDATNGSIDDVKTHAGMFEIESMDFVEYLKRNRGSLHAYVMNNGSLYKATNLDDPWSNFTYGFCHAILGDTDVDPETGLPNNAKQRRYGTFENEIKKSMKSYEDASRAIERAEGAFVKRLVSIDARRKNGELTALTKHQEMTKMLHTDTIVNSLSLALKRGISIINMTYSASRFAVYNVKVSAFITRAYEIYHGKIFIDVMLGSLNLVEKRLEAQRTV